MKHNNSLLQVIIMAEDNISKQCDEIEALSSIYGDIVQVRTNDGQQCCDVHLGNNITLTVTMPVTYPNEAPPVYEISAPYLGRSEKQTLFIKLDEIYADGFIGEPGVIYAWVECIRDFVEERKSSKSTTQQVVEELSVEDVVESFPDHLKIEPISTTAKCPEILTGECIEDRKSVFQPHYSKVTSLEEVKLVLARLYENRKIANATHNMYAYRIKQDGKGVLKDCDDDGETHAGSRMLHLLDILNVENVLVVVSRWFGGIQLGPDRFKHINGATRMILESAGVVEAVKKETSKTGSTKKSKK